MKRPLGWGRYALQKVTAIAEPVAMRVLGTEGSMPDIPGTSRLMTHQSPLVGVRADSDNYPGWPVSKMTGAESGASLNQESFMTDKTCACPQCNCAVDSNTVVEQDHQQFCCEACANHHVNHEKCQSPGCHCEEAAEDKLDEAIEETFPASDPISP